MKQQCILLFIVCQLSVAIGNGQQILTGCQPKDKALIKVLGLSEPDYKKVAREIRCWRINYANRPHQLLVLQQWTDSTWHISSICFCGNAASGGYLGKWQSLEVKSNWPQLWNKLQSWHIETLDDQTIARKRWKSTKDELHVVADGWCYNMEVFTKKHYHRYSYNNPEELLIDFNVNNAELIAINNIADLLKKEFDFQPTNKPCN